MKTYPIPIDLKRIKVFPLAERRSLSTLESILVNPESGPASCHAEAQRDINHCAAQILRARARGPTFMLIYGPPLTKNGAMAIVISLIEGGWITHPATNGAGTIHY